MPISQSFLERCLFAYFKSWCLSQASNLTHIQGLTVILRDRGNQLTTPQPSPSSPLQITNISLEGDFTHNEYFNFCSCHPKDGSLDHLPLRAMGLAFTSPSRLQQVKTQFLMGTEASLCPVAVQCRGNRPKCSLPNFSLEGPQPQILPAVT